MKKLLRHNELFFWVIAILLLYFLPGYKEGQSLCISTLIGLGRCPGCGIGHAIHDALHLRFASSFEYHPLGIFAIIIIFIRLKQLAHLILKNHETKPV